MGTPLTDWDVKINRGILTGFNEAFIISGAKRQELVSKDPKSDEVIRPILRGRDIKRYDYQFADLYLICTFPSRRYDIENFPAVKRHLLTFGYERLEQSGKLNIINGEKIMSRKKTNNKWFETQDSISYWEDFDKQKIVWNRIGKKKTFSFVEPGIFIGDSMHFLTGKHLLYLIALLNSQLMNWLMRLIVGDSVGGNAGNSDNVRCLPIREMMNNEVISNFANELITRKSSSNLIEVENQVDKEVFELYDLTTAEIKLILSQAK